jgi:serine O-acetyltransferase
MVRPPLEAISRKIRIPDQLTRPRSGAACFGDEAAGALVRHEVTRIVEEHAGAAAPVLLTAQRLEAITQRAVEDRLAFSGRDPAAHGSWRHVWESYSAYRATLAYRIAHAVHIASDLAVDRERCRSIARRISETAKVGTSVEIHPAAVIGRRLIVDHGVGTVIGETTVIGDDAYILQGVVLGARGIANNPAGRRHPRLGNRVEVGSFARILGTVEIGDDVLVGPGAVITTDVPNQRRIRVINQYQGTSGQCRVQVFGVVPVAPGVFDVHGTGLADIRVDLLTPDGDRTQAAVLERTHRVTRCAVGRANGDEWLGLVDACGAETVIHNLRSLWGELSQLDAQGAT